MNCKAIHAFMAMAIAIVLGGVSSVAAYATEPQTSYVVAQAAPAAPATAGTSATHLLYSSDTPVGVLLDDAQAKIVLQQLIPTVVNNDQIDMGRDMSLRQMQQYAPDLLSDSMLAKIDAELGKLNASTPSK